MQGYVVTENGEKVLAGTRRPDGTIRKERRIRSGYTPQDEQPVYQSGGVMVKQNIPKCPGLDPDQATASGGGGAKSKAAKKNEKRKAKKADGGHADGGDAASPQAAAAPKQPPAGARPAAAAPAPAAAAAAAAQAPVADGPAAAVDKQIKGLAKKVRQCQALADRQAAGEALTQQEAEKVAKMPAWQEEIRQLEHQLAKLST